MLYFVMKFIRNLLLIEWCDKRLAQETRKRKENIDKKQEIYIIKRKR